MKKFALVASLLAVAVVGYVAFDAPDADAQIRRNSRYPIGTPDTPVQVNGNLEVMKPIFPGNTTLGMVVDGGLTVVGQAQLGKLSVGNPDGGAATRLFFFCQTSLDFASTTTTCTDSAGTTVTGVKTGDACFVGAPTSISGAGTGLNSTFSCYVSAADTVKFRHCAAGTADDPASATFCGTVLSNQ